MNATPLTVDLLRRLRDKRTDFTDRELEVLDAYSDEMLEKGMDPRHDEVGPELIGRAIHTMHAVALIREAPGRKYSSAAAADQYRDEEEGRA